jgi:hypothetical protein
VLCISFTLIYIFTLDFPWLDLSEITLLKLVRLPLYLSHTCKAIDSIIMDIEWLQNIETGLHEQAEATQTHLSHFLASDQRCISADPCRLADTLIWPIHPLQTYSNASKVILTLLWPSTLKSRRHMHHILTPAKSSQHQGWAQVMETHGYSRVDPWENPQV